MCELSGGIFQRTFPARTGDAGSIDRGALAQVGAVAILSMEENQGKTAYFGGIQKCRFREKVIPGDQLKLETKIIRQKGPLGIGEAVASVNGKIAATAELTFMVG